MGLVLLLSLSFASVTAASAPAAPGRVELQAGVLRWSPAAEENTTHSVQYQRFEADRWVDLSRCSRITGNSCDVSALLQEAEHGCVRFRVRAQRGELRSEAEEACSSTEDSCTPQFRLSAAPGSITVHLSRDHTLWEESADHAQHNVCHWVQDQPRQKVCQMSPVSQDLNGLTPGQIYCVEVQYRLFRKLEGVPRCPVCLQVPQASSKLTAIALGITLPLLALALISVSAYVLIFHRKKLKKVKTWFKPEPEPNCLTVPLEFTSVCTTPEEHCSVIDEFRKIDQD